MPHPPPITEAVVRQIVREEIERAFKRDPASRRACLVASMGTLDWACPALILATAAAAAGMQAVIFFTFCGLNIVHEDFEQKLQVSPCARITSFDLGPITRAAAAGAQAMTPSEVRAAMAAGAVVLDMRPPKPFASEHVEDAVSFQFNRADLADRAEMALPREATFIVHAEPEPIARAGVEILSAAGFLVLGYLEGGLKAWTAAELPTQSLPLLDVDEVHERPGEFLVIDAREGFEYRFAHVPRAELLEWTTAWARMNEVAGDRPVAVICGDQVRSAYVASLMQRARKPALIVFGGMADWAQRGYPVEKSARK